MQRILACAVSRSWEETGQVLVWIAEGDWSLRADQTLSAVTQLSRTERHALGYARLHMCVHLRVCVHALVHVCAHCDAWFSFNKVKVSLYENCGQAHTMIA